MRFLKRDVNTSLLLFIAFFLVMFIGFTIYYEYKLRYAVNEKKYSDELLGQVTARFVLSRPNNLSSISKLALIDKAVLEQKYSELVAQNENLKRDIATLQDQLTLLKSQIEYQKTKLDGPTEQFRLIQGKNEQIKDLNEKIKNVCIILKSRNITSEIC